MLKFRNASQDDLKALLPLLKDLSYETTYDILKKRLEPVFNHPDYTLMIGETNGTPVSLCAYVKMYPVEFDGNYYRVLAFVVSKSVQGQGIGTKMIDELKRRAISEDVKLIALNSGDRPERYPAHQFYLNNGFNYYSKEFKLKLD